MDMVNMDMVDTDMVETDKMDTDNVRGTWTPVKLVHYWVRHTRRDVYFKVMNKAIKEAFKLTSKITRTHENPPPTH